MLLEREIGIIHEKIGNKPKVISAVSNNLLPQLGLTSEDLVVGLSIKDIDYRNSVGDVLIKISPLITSLPNYGLYPLDFRLREAEIKQAEGRHFFGKIDNSVITLVDSVPADKIKFQKGRGSQWVGSEYVPEIVNTITFLVETGVYASGVGLTSSVKNLLSLYSFRMKNTDSGRYEILGRGENSEFGLGFEIRPKNDRKGSVSRLLTFSSGAVVDNIKREALTHIVSGGLPGLGKR